MLLGKGGWGRWILDRKKWVGMTDGYDVVML
jgi:hypothetical protein